jgi:HEAT repeat protein
MLTQGSSCNHLAGWLVLLAGAAGERDQLRRNDDLTRWLAAQALGQMGPAARAAVPALVAALDDPTEEVALNALAALHAIAPDDRSAVPAVVRRLEIDGGPWQDWADASAWLGAERDRALAKSVLPRLVEQLRQATADTWPTLEVQLRHLGPVARDAAPILERIFHTPPKGVSRVGVLLAWLAVSDDPVPALRAGLGHGDEEVRYWAVHWMRDSDSPAAGALPALVEAMRSGKGASNPVSQQAFAAILAVAESRPRAAALAETLQMPPFCAEAVAALGRMGPEARPALAALRGLLKDEKHRVGVAWAMVSIGGPDREALAVLESAFMADSWQEWETALVLAGALGPQARGLAAAVRRRLAADSGDERLEAARALARIEPGDAEALAVLAAELRGEDWKTALIALAELGPLAAGTGADLAAFLQEASGSKEKESLWALVRLGPGAAPAVGVLRERLRRQWDDEPALDILTAVGPAAAPAVPELSALLHAPSPRVRAQAAEALGRIGPAAHSARERLRRQYEEDEAEPRAWAAFALARIEADARPGLAECILPGLLDVRCSALRAAAALLRRPIPSDDPDRRPLRALRSSWNDPWNRGIVY